MSLSKGNMDNNYIHFMIAQALVDSLKSVLGDDTKQFMPIIYKMSAGLTSQQDVENASAFFSKLYQSGYIKSLDAHKEAFAKMGMQAVVMPPQNQDGIETACSL